MVDALITLPIMGLRDRTARDVVTPLSKPSTNYYGNGLVANLRAAPRWPLAGGAQVPSVGAPHVDK